MRRRHTILALLAVAAIVSACGARPSPSEDAGQVPATPGSSLVPRDGSRCEEIGYPCSRSEVDPAVLERESRYSDQLRPMLAEGARDDALAWIRQQEGVVEAAANETAFMFRLEGGRPSFFFRAPPEGPPDTSADAFDIPDAVFASAVMPAPTRSTDLEAGVVGAGTDRETQQNRKRALFLEPWASHRLDGFKDMIRAPREIPDYEDLSAITYWPNAEVTPDEFFGWDNYDAIFVRTHGGMLHGEAFVSTGVKRLLGDGDKDEICDELMSWWEGQVGVDCAEQEEWLPDPNTGDFVRDAEGRRIFVDWVVVGVQPDFFWEQYGRHGGLQRAIVYIGACDGLTETVLADSIAGATSAFLGWNGQPWRSTEKNASRALLGMLIEERDTVLVAHTRACERDRCRDSGADGAALEIYQNGPEPKMLRLYDLGTPRDPRAPGEVLGDGAELRFRGTAGDRHNDQLELIIEVIGVVDPGDSDASDGSVAEGYDVKVYVGDEVISAANLADEDRPTEQIVALDATTYRYTFLADLEFDVPVDGYETTLKVEVELPEGGISDYEVDILLVEPGMGATVTVGDETWEFQLSTAFGLDGCITDTDTQITASAQVDGDLEGASLWADLRPDLWHVEVNDPDSGRTWLAAAERSHMTVLHLVPDGDSQVDELTIEDGRAWGTATFIEANAFIEAWNVNETYPSPVTGSFEIRCR